MKAAQVMLAALRSALYVLFLAVSVVPWALVVLLIAPFSSSTTIYWSCAGWLKLSIWGARVICGVRYRVRGMHNVPTAADATRAVLLANLVPCTSRGTAWSRTTSTVVKQYTC